MASKKQKAEAAEKQVTPEEVPAAESGTDKVTSEENGQDSVPETPSAEQAEEESPETSGEIEKLREEYNNLKDQLLRKTADFENYRKRVAREKQESVRYANQDLLRDLIEVIDNFERAIKSSEDSQDFTLFRDGIAMIEQQFTTLLSTKWGLSKIESEGKEYNPVFHEAVMMEESDEYDKPVVVEDYQTGYRLHDRVIRPSRVKVGKPAAETVVNDAGQESRA